MSNIKWLRLAGLVTALGTAATALLSGDYLSAVGIASAALSATGIRVNAAAQ